MKQCHQQLLLTHFITESHCQKAILLARRHFHLPSTNCCFLSLSKTVYRCKKPKDRFRRGPSMHTSPTPCRPKCFQIHGGFRIYGLEPHPSRLEEFPFRHSKTQLSLLCCDCQQAVALVTNAVGQFSVACSHSVSTCNIIN